LIKELRQNLKVQAPVLIYCGYVEGALEWTKGLASVLVTRNPADVEKYIRFEPFVDPRADLDYAALREAAPLIREGKDKEDYGFDKIFIERQTPDENVTITAPALHHHCTITAPSLHHH